MAAYVSVIDKADSFLFQLERDGSNPKVILFVRLSKATYVLFIDGTHSFLFQLERGGPTFLSYLLRTSLRQLMCQSLTNQSFRVVLERDGTGEGIDYISQCMKIVFVMLS